MIKTLTIHGHAKNFKHAEDKIWMAILQAYPGITKHEYEITHVDLEPMYTMGGELGPFFELYATVEVRK